MQRWWSGIRTGAVCALLATGMAQAADQVTALAPLDEHNDVAPPQGSAGDPYPERLQLVLEEGSAYTCARAKGYLHAPVDTVLAALRDPEVVVDRREVASWTSEHGADPATTASFRIHNEVHALVTVEFDTAWRIARTSGDGKAALVTARADKVAGTRFISLLSDSVVVRSIDAQTSVVELIRHRKGLRGDRDAEAYVRDLFASLKARVHGEALPKY